MNRRPVTDALRNRLADVVTWASVEVGQRLTDPPVIVVHPLPGGIPSQMLDGPSSLKHGHTLYQLTCVGVAGTSGREQAEQLAADAVAALVGWTDDTVAAVTVDTFGDARPDHDEQPAVWFSTPTVQVAARSS